MKILMIHNYLRPPSGENTVFEQETALLREKGHHVITYTKNNDEICRLSKASRLLLPFRAIWSSRVCNDLAALIKIERPHVAHFHNIFPLISPAAYCLCQKMNVPVVQTLHNFRIVCPGALLFRNGEVCEDCSGMHFLPGVTYGCYRRSRIATAGMATVILFHKWIETWQRAVDLYIALSEFAANKYRELGFPSRAFYVKPNFLENAGSPSCSDDGYGIYIGRIGEEKGMRYLLSALKKCPTVNFVIVGDGPLREYLEHKLVEWRLNKVQYFGVVRHADCVDLLKHARFHVLPSQCYEGSPMVLLEAMSAGKPSIVSDIGILPKIVKNGENGLVIKAGSDTELASKMLWMSEHAEETREMGKRARKRFETSYSRDVNYFMIMDAYLRAIEMQCGEKGRG